MGHPMPPSLAVEVLQAAVGTDNNELMLTFPSNTDNGVHFRSVKWHVESLAVFQGRERER
jgi:hypothetical protein